MQIFHLDSRAYTVSQWSGGTTTEVFIWPKDANYASREFAVRISFATVELEESDFTALPGVTRYIVPLQGGFTLSHPGSAPVVMGPMSKPYRFSGEIPTHCVGKATDFNLMLKGVEGEMALCHETWQLRPGFNCLYAVEDTVVELENGYALRAGELLVVFAEKACRVAVSAESITCFANV